MNRAVRGTLALALVLALAPGGRAEDRPFRAWPEPPPPPRPLEPDERIEQIPLPNGKVGLFRVGPKARRPELIGILEQDATLSLARAGKFPNEKKASELARKGDQEEALVELLDKALASDEGGRTLLRPPWESSAWTSARTLARERLLALGPEARIAWRKLRDDEAAPRFKAALAAANAHGVEALLDRYPVATDSARTCVRAGQLFFEQGELGAAIRLLERARADYADEVDVAAIGSWIARARILAAGARGARRAPHVVHAPRAATAAMGDAWVASLREPPLRLLWRRAVDAPALAEPRREPSFVASGDGGTVYVPGADRLLALESETGRLRWDAPLPRVDALDPGDVATVSADEQVIAIRGRRAFVFERSTGRLALELDLARHLGSIANDDRIDQGRSERGLVYLVASVGGDRIVAAFDRQGERIWKTDLWSAQKHDARLVLSEDGIFVLADGGVASLDRGGALRWARGAKPVWSDPGRSPERDLVRAGERLVVLEHFGLAVLDAATGDRRSLPPVPPDVLVVGTSPEHGPLLVNPHPPRGGPQLIRAEGRAALIVARLDDATRPAWPGVVDEETLYLPAENELVAIDVLAGRTTKCPWPGPAKLSVVDDVVIASRGDEVLAFARRELPATSVELPKDAAALATLLGDPDWRVRRAARERLRTMGTAAEPALRALLDGTASPEARDSARTLLRTALERGRWSRALQGLADAPTILERLSSHEPEVRARGLRMIDGAPATPELLQALRGVAREDSSIEVRFEAVALLARHDDKVREAIAAVLLDANANVVGRASAAEAIVNSGGAHATSPSNAVLGKALANTQDEVRGVTYRALLVHGGPRETALVQEAAKKDPIAVQVARAWAVERLNAGKNPLAPGKQRSNVPEEDRRGLLERVKVELVPR